MLKYISSERSTTREGSYGTPRSRFSLDSDLLRHTDESVAAKIGTAGKIIIVDDDPPLLRTMEIFLTRRGYQVVACESGRKALEKIGAEPAAYSVLVVDMTLQDMHAAELVEQLLSLESRVGVVVTSGYPVRLPLFAAAADDRIVALQKPFTPEILVQTIERMLS